MTPKQQYYENTAKTILKNFEKRGFTGCYCPTCEEAVKAAMCYVRPGMEVSFGGSMTLFEAKLMDALKEQNDITLLDRSLAADPEKVREIYHRALSCDCYFMSANAITIEGELVNIDGTGNRLAALLYGPSSVVILAGMNKVCADVKEAYSRVKSKASPPNCLRLNRNTPCALTGVCHDCYGDDCICSHTVITRRSAEKGRIKIILIGEELGY